MNRSDFQSLAIQRLHDAAALLKAGRYAAAYYVSGYAVECALKACIARRTRQDEFPPKEAAKYYTHDLSKLLDFASLQSTFDQEATHDVAFRTNWAAVKDWTEESRYQAQREERQATEILRAIDDSDHGVLQWLKGNW